MIAALMGRWRPLGGGDPGGELVMIVKISQREEKTIEKIHTKIHQTTTTIQQKRPQRIREDWVLGTTIR
jgi:hypothetical protein